MLTRKKKINLTICINHMRSAELHFINEEGSMKFLLCFCLFCLNVVELIMGVIVTADLDDD